MMNDMQYYTQRIQCSYEDKLHCLETAKKLYLLAMLARKSGLLALEEATENDPDLFLKTAVDSMLELADYELVKICLHGYLISGDYHGGDFLKNVLIVNGLLFFLSQ